MLSNDLVRTIPLAMGSLRGRQVVTGLKHDSRYEFRVVLINAVGRTSNFTSGFNTTVGELININSIFDFIDEPGLSSIMPVVIDMLVISSAITAIVD